MDCALMVTGAALEAITQESLMEDWGLVTKKHFEVGEFLYHCHALTSNHRYIYIYVYRTYVCTVIYIKPR